MEELFLEGSDYPVRFTKSDKIQSSLDSYFVEMSYEQGISDAQSLCESAGHMMTLLFSDGIWYNLSKQSLMGYSSDQAWHFANAVRDVRLQSIGTHTARIDLHPRCIEKILVEDYMDHWRNMPDRGESVPAEKTLRKRVINCCRVNILLPCPDELRRYSELDQQHSISLKKAVVSEYGVTNVIMSSLDEDYERLLEMAQYKVFKITGNRFFRELFRFLNKRSNGVRFEFKKR